MNSTPSLPIKKKTNTKKRSNGKRAKRACFHCKKAKTSCSNERPCTRCVRLGLTETCIDTPRSDIREEEKQLWEHTLQYLTSTKQSNSDKDEKALRGIITQYARRVSGETVDQQVATVPPPSFLLEPHQYQSQSPIHFENFGIRSKGGNEQVKYLAQQNQILAAQVQSLLRELEKKKELTVSIYVICTDNGLLWKWQRSFYSFSALTTFGDVAYSRWTYPSHSLLDYNRGFLELSGRSPAELQVNRFNIRQLHHQKHIFSCSAALYLLSHGLANYIELNQEWWTPTGPIHVKSYLNVNLDENEQSGEVILFSKRSSVPFLEHTLFKPIEIGLSEKAKLRGFDLKEYFHVQIGQHGLLKDCPSVIKEDEGAPYKMKYKFNNGPDSPCAKDSSYSASPPSVSPSFPSTISTPPLFPDISNVPGNETAAPKAEQSVPVPLDSDLSSMLPDLGDDLEESLSFLESLNSASEFTDLFPGTKEEANTAPPSSLHPSFSSLLSSEPF